MGAASQDLFSTASGAIWDLLTRLRADAAGVLAGLGPEPKVAGTALEGRLLAAIPPDAIATNDPGAAALLRSLKALLPTGGGDLPVTLHGYDPGAGQPRGLALMFVTPPPSAIVVAAVSGDGPAGIALEIAGVGAGAVGPATIALLDGWSVDIGGDAGGGGDLQFPRGQPPRVLGAGAAVRPTWTLRRAPGGSDILLGPAEGPNLRISEAAVAVAIALDAGGAPAPTFRISSPNARLSLASDLLSALVGDALDLPIDLDIDADPQAGIVLAGGGVRATVPADVSVPGLDLRAVELSITSAGGGLEFGFGVGFTAGYAGLPLNFTVDGLGAAFPFALGGGGFGIGAGAVRALAPSGIGVDLSLPVVSGGGFLETTGPGGYGGVLAFDLIAIELQAFGLLQLPVAGQSLSFVAILSVQFPPPGIQLSFGFSLNAVGGIVAINRRLDTQALQASVFDGSINQLLFPVDPASHALTIIATMGRVFPAADGHVVVGPMLQIGWGGRIITLSLAVVLDLPNPVQFVLIGRLTVALPDPAVPLVLLQATLAGAFEISPTPQTSLSASLAGSNIAGIQLHGDLFFLLRGGDDPLFVLSIGGFHPRYVRPAGIPALSRVQLDLLPPGFPGLRSETYFAITSNSVQFGAHMQLCDEIAGCGVDGWFDFDTLFLWDPEFSFSVHASAGVAVQVLGETLMGVAFDLVLEGPAPWHVHGSGSVDLFLFSASLDFEAKWGPSPIALPPPLDLGAVLAAALADPNAWTAAPPSGVDTSGVTLSSKALAQIGQGHVMHPLGQIAVRQRALPLGIEISRYQNQPIATQQWTLASANLDADIPAAQLAPTTDEFPAGAFLTFTEDEKLAKPAFEQFTSGAWLSPDGHTAGDMRRVDSDFEVVLVPEITVVTAIFDPALLALILEAEMLLGLPDPHLVEAFWSAPGLAGVSVLASQPVAVATTDTFAPVLRPLNAVSAPDNYTAALQTAQAQFGDVGPAHDVQIVEQWELAA